MDKEQLIQGILESLAKLQRPVINVAYPAGVSRAQAGILFLLLYHKKLNSKQVAEFLGVSKSAATQLVDPLLDKSLVSRRIDDKDRRVGWLELTPNGIKTLKELSKQKFAGLRGSLSNLSQADLQTLYKLHKKLADQL